MNIKEAIEKLKWLSEQISPSPIKEAIDTVLSSKNTEKKTGLDENLLEKGIDQPDNQDVLSSKKDRLYTAEETQDFAEWCSLHNWTCYDSKMWLRMYRGERMTGDAKTTAQLRELWKKEREEASVKITDMKYYNFRITNLGMGWWRWKPKYLPKLKQKARGYFFWFNWRIEWWFTDNPE